MTGSRGLLALVATLPLVLAVAADRPAGADSERQRLVELSRIDDTNWR